MRITSDLGFAFAPDGVVIDPETGEQSERASAAASSWIQRNVDPVPDRNCCGGRRAAGCPGLQVFTSDTYGEQLERCDECGRFASDDEALAHVLALGAPRWVTDPGWVFVRSESIRVFEGAPSAAAWSALVELCAELERIGARAGMASLTASPMRPDPAKGIRGTWIIVTTRRDPQWVRGFVGGFLHRWGLEH